jgi:hypothetical protein
VADAVRSGALVPPPTVWRDRELPAHLANFAPMPGPGG